MLKGFPISARAAAVDLGRARHWYEAKLGLVPAREDPGGVWHRFGLADFVMAKVAWFKDSEGNTYELSEVL